MIAQRATIRSGSIAVVVVGVIAVEVVEVVVVEIEVVVVVVSSVRSSSGYHGLIEIRNPLFQFFSNSSDSKVKVKVKGPNMCYIFEKHGIQGYRI